MRGSKGLIAAPVLLASLVSMILTAAPASTADPPASAADAADGSGQAASGVGPRDWTVEAFTLDVTTGPDDAFTIPVDADVWKPDGATASDPVPAVIILHGFGLNKDSPEVLAHAAYLASHGYAVVAITAQGFGASGGCIALDRVDYDVKNVRQFVDWVAGQDFVATTAPGDPKVGLLGGSYGGGAQGLVAVTDPRVDAIAPGRTWHTLQYSLVPNNWIPDPAAPWDLDGPSQGVFKQEWTSLFFAAGSAEPAMGHGGCDPASQQSRYPGATPCPGFIPRTCETYARIATTGDATDADRELVAGSAIATRLGDLRTPTLLTQGLPDTLFNPNETVPTFLALRERGVPTAMIWHSSGHGGYQGAPGDGEAYTGQWDDSAASQEEFARMYLPRRTLNWFERHVRGRRDVDTGPAFAWFRPWIDYDVADTGGTAAPAYGISDTFPAPQTSATTLTLDPATEGLARDGDSVEGGSVSFVNPPGGMPAAYSEVSNFSSPGQPGDRPATELPGQHATFTTAPFDAPTELVGVPTLRVHLGHANPAQDAVVFAKLYDVAPDGSATLLRRMVAPARIPTAALEEGPVQMRLVGTSWQFDAGHSLRLVLASTDSAYRGARLPDQLTVSSSSDAPSTLQVPLVLGGPPPGGVEPDGTAPEGTPDGGGPDGQPRPGSASDTGLPATGGGAGATAVGLVALAAAAARRRPRPSDEPQADVR